MVKERQDLNRLAINHAAACAFRAANFPPESESGRTIWNGIAAASGGQIG
jgi:hypothetical protein